MTTKLIGYRKLKSFRTTDAGPFDIELGSFSIWDQVCVVDTGLSYRIWLDLETLPDDLDDLDELDSSCEAETEEEAKQIVLDHIRKADVSKYVFSHSDSFMCFSTAFSRISPDAQAKFLPFMEVRI